MDQHRPHDAHVFEEVASRLGSGLIFVAANGDVVWMDEATRRCIDGQLRDLQFPIQRDEQAVDCFITTLNVVINGEARQLCVVQAITPNEAARNILHGLMENAVKEALSDASWLIRPLTEKLKAACQAAQPHSRTTDLDLLTAREREILALICEGRSDAEMSEILHLSQNTVRNHVASLFRKIGVNRRSAAIIWARERGITGQDAFALGNSRHLRHTT